MCNRFKLTLIGFFTVFSLLAQEPLQLNRIVQPIKFDGIVSDAEWSMIPTMPLTMHIPNFGEQESEQSFIRLVHDNNYLYLSGNMLDKEPDKILATSKKRDALIANTDWFGIIIDSYNDKQNALAFFTNPNGIRLDLSVFNDANGGFPINTSWNNFWDVVTTRDDKGWQVEMRIPFTSLQFEPIDGEATMGIIIWRYISRKNEIDMYPPIRPDFGEWSAWKPSLAQEVTISDVEPKKPFYVAPYVLAGHGLSNELNEAETEYIHDEGRIFDVGLDLKYGITNNVTLDLSLNTDFAQVEADDQQVNLTRFSLFFPEKRLFFQERSSIFNYSFGRTDQLFYSRQIGIFDGTPVPIYGGARVVGRAGDLDFGVLSMQAAPVDTLGSENFTVARFKKRAFNENSDIGGIITNRMDFSGNYNTSYGFDGNIRVIGQDFLNVRIAQSLQHDKPNELLSMDPTKWWVSWSRRQNKGFGYASSISRAGKDFEPGMGFQERDNYTRWGSRISYDWLPENGGVFLHGPSIRSSWHWDNSDNRTSSIFRQLAYKIQTKTGWRFELNYESQFEKIIEEFELPGDTEIPVGEYWFGGLGLEIATLPTFPIYAGAEFSFGQFYDGTRLNCQISPTYNVSSSLEVGMSYIFNHVRFEDRNQAFDVHLARLKALVMFNTKLSISTFVQYNSDIKSFLGNVRLRYNPREGVDFYIVFNDDVNTDRDRDFLTYPIHNQRSILLKYTHTLRI